MKRIMLQTILESGVLVAGSQSAMKCIFYRLDWIGGITTYEIIIKRQLLMKPLPSKM